MTEPTGTTRFRYQGRPLTAPRGATVASALLANGITSWRTTRGSGRPRGLFCGIGNCYDCLVDTGAGVPVRACQAPLGEDGDIRPLAGWSGGMTAAPAGTASADRSTAAPPAEATSAEALSAEAPSVTARPAATRPAAAAGRVVRTEVAVLGAGPAGMSAALAAADAGCAVTLVDTAPLIGGQIYRQDQRPEPGASAPAPVTAGLPARFRPVIGNPAIRVIGGTGIWHAQQPGSGGFRLYCTGGGPPRVDAAAVVLAAGAAELVFPFPGWTLPGVVTAGAAQALIKAQRTLVGRRVLVAGTGPLLLPAALSLARQGARVVAVCELAHPARLLFRAAGLARFPAKAREGAGYLAALTRQRIRLRSGWAITACEGAEKVERAVIAPVDRQGRVTGGSRTVAVDAVAVSMGFVPAIELARALECRCDPLPHRPAAVVAVGSRQETSTPGVFACGEITGVGGADLAEAEGAVAGMAAAAYLGTLDDAAFRDRAARPMRRIRRARRFTVWLDKTYPLAGHWADRLQPGTIVCRCEEVAWADLAEALALGAADLRAVKGLTRCGMGYCQGRVCGPALQYLTARARGLPLTAVGDLHGRPIAIPTAIGTLAASAGTGSPP